MRFELTDGKPVAVVEVCDNCGKGPQAPAWDQCYGCGESGTVRKYVPVEQCEPYGTLGYKIKSPTGVDR